ncbi:Ionotropic receptor 75d [Carabus blaptoides fortunei]
MSQTNDYIVVDLNCPDARNLLEIANSTHGYRSPYKWILIETGTRTNNNKSDVTDIAIETDDMFEGSCKEYVKDLEILVDAELTCAVKFGSKLLLWQYYIVTENKILVREKYGEWTEENGLDIQYKYKVTSFRRKNLRHTTIRIVCVIDDNDTYNHLDDFRFPMVDMLTKAQFGIMMSLIYYMNSSWTIVHTGHFGVKTETGRWSGLSGALEQKRADITGSSIHIENPQNEDKDKVEFGNILLLVSAALCQQGCDIVPSGVPGRILTLLVFTSLMFLYVAYSANIVVLLQSTSESIKTKEDLLKSRLKVGAHNISYNRYWLINATHPVYKAIYKEKMAPNGFYNLSEGINKVRQGLFAFHVENGAGYYYILKTFHEHEKCECTEMTGVIEGIFGYISCQNETQYYEMFMIGLLKIGEGGIEKRFLKRFYRNTKCTHVAASFTSVGIIDFYPAILVYFCGVACAFLVFILEHILHKYSRKYRSKEVNIFSPSHKIKKNMTLPLRAPINPY